MIRRVWRLALVPSIAVACVGDTPIERAIVRDSGGIRIVENPASAEPLPWTVSTDPIVDIGDAAAGEAYALHRIVGVTRLADGSIAIANGGSHELRIFDAAGEHRRTTGRQGEGPGEFQGLFWMGRKRGDTIVTYDVQLQRVSFFDASGSFVRSLQLEKTGDVPFASINGVFGDGSFLGQGFAQTGNVIPNGLQRYPSPAYHFGDDGAFLADLGLFDGQEGFYESFPDGGFSFTAALFPLTTFKRVAGNSLLLADNGTYELRKLTPDGELLSVVRRAFPQVAVTPAHVGAVWSRREAGGEERNDNVPVPSAFPAFDQIRVDAGGRIWVRQYLILGEPTATWAVFGADGMLLGEVAMPPELDVWEVGEDYVLGVRRDTFDVEHVRLHRLTKGSSSPG